MKKRVKRLLPLFLCLCMLMSGTAYAQDGNGDNPEAETVEGQGQEKESGEKTGAEAAEKAGASAAEEESAEEPEIPAVKETEASAAKELGAAAVQEAESAEEAQPGVSAYALGMAAGGSQPAALAAGDVAINEANFPDPVFRDYVSKRFDTDGNGSLSESERNAVERIDVFNRGISDLTGIQYFTKLMALSCGSNQLENLEVSGNTALERLWCSGNQLTVLDVSRNTVLMDLECGANQLTSLDVNKNTALESLKCPANQLISLDVSKNAALKLLNCDRNQLTSLDVSNNATLEWLSCSRNRLTDLDVSSNVILKSLDCNANQLTSLDISNHASLQWLDCAPVPKENVKYNSNMLDRFIYGGKSVYTTAYLQGGTWKVDLSAIAPLEEWEKIFPINSVDTIGENMDKETGIWDLGTEQREWRIYDMQESQEGAIPLELAEVFVHVTYGEPGETVKAETDGTNVKADTSKVDTTAVYKAFGIGPGDTNVEIKVEQKEADGASRERMAEILKQSGDTALGVYEVVMSLYANGTSKGTVTDGFGSLTLSFYAGKEHAGKKAVVYQLHGSDEVLTYKDLTIDSEGMVTISVSKLSSFAVALQNDSGAGTGQPGTGNSGTGGGSGTSNGQTGTGNGSGTGSVQTGTGNGSGTDSKQPVAGNGSGTAGKTSTASVQKTSPKTGDPGHMVLWITVMFFFGGITAFAISRKWHR